MNFPDQSAPGKNVHIALNKILVSSIRWGLTHFIVETDVTPWSWVYCLLCAFQNTVGEWYSFEKSPLSLEYWLKTSLQIKILSITWSC